jgi:hypothetical protein
LSTAVSPSSSNSGGTQPPSRNAQRYTLNSCIQSNAVAPTYSRPANPLKLTHELDQLDQLLAQAEAVNSSTAASASTSSTVNDVDFFVGDSRIPSTKNKNTVSKAPGSAATAEHVTAGMQHLSLKHKEEEVVHTSSRAKVQSAKTAVHPHTSMDASNKNAKENNSASSSSDEHSSSDEQEDKKGSESGEDYSDDEDEGEEGYKAGGYHRVRIGDVYNQR